MTDFPKPPFPEQTQDAPGSFLQMDPRPDHGEFTWVGAGRLDGRIALITGADSGIGRAVATTFVMLAEPMSSFVSGATIAVTGGAPML